MKFEISLCCFCFVVVLVYDINILYEGNVAFSYKNLPIFLLYLLLICYIIMLLHYIELSLQKSRIQYLYIILEIPFI